jgi:hypothetical protein
MGGLPHVLFLPIAKMFNSHVGKSNNLIMGGVKGVMMGALGFSASTNSKPTISFPFSHEVGSAAGASTGAGTGATIGEVGPSQSKKSTVTVWHPCSPILQRLSVYVHALSLVIPMGGFTDLIDSPATSPNNVYGANF